MNDLEQGLKEAQQDNDVKSVKINDLEQRLKEPQQDNDVMLVKMNDLEQRLKEAPHDNDVKSVKMNDLEQRLKEAQHDNDVMSEGSVLPAPAAETQTTRWWFRCPKGLLKAGVVAAVAGLGIANTLMSQTGA
ncbi:hypothetical protein VZT92_012610 [Zoarces viviparus]|uniref:Uncharacterized protein n=1 Tax=Zoarces viviparus TaxID=48416 RepID=A0AAW1F1F7_ZOAVI